MGRWYTRFDFVISSSHINHLAGLLESSAVVRTKCIFEMYEQLISTSQKQFLLNVLLKYLPFYVLVVNSDEYIVNFHQTNCGEVVDQILKIDSNNETSVVTSVDEEVEKQPKLSVYRKRGQPLIVSKFSEIPEVITHFLKINGFKAQEKR